MSVLVATKPRDRGRAFFDEGSAASLGVGLTAGWFGVDPSIAMLTFLTAKLVKRSLEDGSRQAFFDTDRESLANNIADVAVGFLGTKLGAALRQHRDLALLAQQQAAAQPTPNVAAGIGAYYTFPTR